MSRISEDFVTVREAFIRRFFHANPLKGCKEANDALAADPLCGMGGKRMGLKRIYELEAEVKGAKRENLAGLLQASQAHPPANLTLVTNVRLEDVIVERDAFKAAADMAQAQAHALSLQVSALTEALADARKASGPAASDSAANVAV